MEPSIFTKIIHGDIPCHKIYEDDSTLAFLDIHPAVEGHTLVVPKMQVDRLEDLPAADYRALMQSVQKVARRLALVYGPSYRVCLKVEGFDVPHAHVHLLPCRNAEDYARTGDPASSPDHKWLAQIAERLFFS